MARRPGRNIHVRGKPLYIMKISLLLSSLSSKSRECVLFSICNQTTVLRHLNGRSRSRAFLLGRCIKSAKSTKFPALNGKGPSYMLRNAGLAVWCADELRLNFLVNDTRQLVSWGQESITAVCGNMLTSPLGHSSGQQTRRCSHAVKEIAVHKVLFRLGCVIVLEVFENVFSPDQVSCWSPWRKLICFPFSIRRRPPAARIYRWSKESVGKKGLTLIVGNRLPMHHRS